MHRKLCPSLLGNVPFLFYHSPAPSQFQENPYSYGGPHRFELCGDRDVAGAVCDRSAYLDQPPDSQRGGPLLSHLDRVVYFCWLRRLFYSSLYDLYQNLPYRLHLGSEGREREVHSRSSGTNQNLPSRDWDRIKNQWSMQNDQWSMENV